MPDSTLLVDQAERQVVGLCLYYPQAADMAGDLRGDDFPTRWLGQLFEASRLTPPLPARPGPTPECDPALWAETPLPPAWKAWLANVENWRPRHAATLVGVDVDVAVALHDECSTLNTLPRFVSVIRDAAEKDHLRLVAQTALSLLDHNADVGEIRAVLKGALRGARAS